MGQLFFWHFIQTEIIDASEGIGTFKSIYLVITINQSIISFIFVIRLSMTFCTRSPVKNI
jgi:hypothetical protein